MLVVVALGGNALLRRDEPADVATPARATSHVAVEAIAALAAEPRRGRHARQRPADRPAGAAGRGLSRGRRYPLDVLGAESEGMIGYLLDQELVNALGGRARRDPADTGASSTRTTRRSSGRPSRSAPSTTARRRAPGGASADGRLPATESASAASSPRREPRAIVELPTIRLLVEAGVLVVCVGGGGIPVAVDADGRLRGVEAVIDKDLAAALLARSLGADALLLLTDVPAVEVGWGTADARAAERGPGDRAARASTSSPARWARRSRRRALRRGDRRFAAIGALGDAPAILRGERGTRIRPM